jgi:hypothetical protein
MKKLSPKKFSKIYLYGAWITLFTSLFSFIIGILIYDKINRLGMIFLYISLFSFIICIGFIAWGSKRYKHLHEERLAEELKQQNDKPHPISVHWIKINSDNTTIEGDTIFIDDDGIELDDHELLPWGLIKVAEHLYGFILLSEEPYQEQSWNGVFVEAIPLVITLLEQHLNCPINQDKLENLQLEYNEVVQSTLTWHYNWSLFIEKCLFITVVLLSGVAISLYLDSTTIANVYAISMFLFIYPKIFKGSNKRSYLINKAGIGYAKGRYRIYIPWKNIQKMMIDKRNLTIIYQDDVDEDRGTLESLSIPNEKLLIKRVKEYQEQYHLTFQYDEIEG